MKLKGLVLTVLSAGVAIGAAGCGSPRAATPSPSMLAKDAAGQPAASATAFVRPLSDTHTLVDIRFNTGQTDRSLHGPYPYLSNATVASRELTMQSPVNPNWNITDGYVYLLTDPSLRFESGVKEGGEAEPTSGRPRLARTGRIKISTPNCKVIVWVLATAEGTIRERVFHCVDDRPGADGAITVTTVRATIKSVEVPEGQYVDITESSGTLDVSAPQPIPPRTANPSTSIGRFLKYVDQKQAAAGLAASPW